MDEWNHIGYSVEIRGDMHLNTEGLQFFICRQGIVYRGPGHHGQLPAVHPEDPEHPRAYPVFHEILQTHVPVQGTVRLLEVQKYLIADRLPHGGKLLQQIGLEGISPHTAAQPKPIGKFMELDCRGETEVQDPLHSL